MGNRDVYRRNREPVWILFGNLYSGFGDNVAGGKARFRFRAIDVSISVQYPPFAFQEIPNRIKRSVEPPAREC